MIRVPADLSVDSLLSAYRAGYFPMPVRRRIAWFSPNPRGIFLPGHMRTTRSLERSRRRYEIRVNSAFAEVITACADPGRPLGWINRAIVESFTALHHAGHAHSVEAGDSEGLAGGLYCVSVGGFFAGESMCHRRTDASKVALTAWD
ncbi:MAG: leucyl/phenylalanyl-tRNA--protein transferase, partial [Acidimicrobiia bacterium]